MLDSETISIPVLIPPMVRLVAHPNCDIKRQACQFLCIASNSTLPQGKEIGLLAVNALNKDLEDPNPAIREVAVSTICTLDILADQHAIPGQVKKYTKIHE